MKRLGTLSAVWGAAAWFGLAAACGTEAPSDFGPGIGPGEDAAPGAPPPIGASGAAPDGAAGDAGNSFAPCGSQAECAGETVCKHGACLPNLGPCETSNDCPGDSYCDADKTCVPYGYPAGADHDPTCQRPQAPGVVQPTVQCEWNDADAADPTAGYSRSYTAPLVANLNLQDDLGKLEPSIILTTFATSGEDRIGMLRVFDGRSCTETMRIGGPDDPEAASNRPGYGTQWAVGDLDGDVGTPTGHPEIVGLHRLGAVPVGALATPKLTPIAFKVDTSVPGAPKLTRAWEARTCGVGGAPDVPFVLPAATNQFNFGPGLWDLDDDGRPEIIIDKFVFDSQGCVQNPGASVSDYLALGVLNTVADVDLDGKPDLVRYDGIYGWDTAAKDWVLKPYFAPTNAAAATKPGQVAVANLGSYSTLPGVPATAALPEIVVVSAAGNGANPKSTGSIRVMTLTGQIVFGPMDLPRDPPPNPANPDEISQYGGHGGAPTIADFDGDGQVEFAAAGNRYYSVFDPDCSSETALPERPGGVCNRPGPRDGVLWKRASQDYSSSSTGSSVFDFNGDGTAEVVYRDECYVRVYDGRTGEVRFSAPASSGTGFELPVIADVGGTFTTQIVTARTSHTGCPAVDPLNPASGAFVAKNGFVVLKDPEDRWVSSRPIWNQHAYSVTNVGDRGEIPRSSLVQSNWQTVGLNNFRQNVQGALGVTHIANFTVELTDLDGVCHASGPLDLKAKVCNRGTNPAPNGVTVRFTSQPKDDATAAETLVCETSTPSTLDVGQCVPVTCNGNVAGDVNVFVSVDPDDTIATCHPGNKRGAGSSRLCPDVN